VGRIAIIEGEWEWAGFGSRHVLQHLAELRFVRYCSLPFPVVTLYLIGVSIRDAALISSQACLKALKSIP